MDESTGNQQSFFQAGTAEQSSHSLFSPFGLGPQETLEYRKRFRGMISVTSKVPLKDAATPSRCSLMAHLLSVSATLVQWQPCPYSKTPASSSKH